MIWVNSVSHILKLLILHTQDQFSENLFPAVFSKEALQLGSCIKGRLAKLMTVSELKPGSIVSNDMAAQDSWL